jgi:leucyl-tRNA synthetase
LNQFVANDGGFTAELTRLIEGIAVNSGFLDGLPTPKRKKKITAWLEEKGLGKGTVNFKLRDWLFSRQRYWGEPFPIVWEDGKHRCIPESELPLLPPTLGRLQTDRHARAAAVESHGLGALLRHRDA